MRGGVASVFLALLAGHVIFSFQTGNNVRTRRRGVFVFGLTGRPRRRGLFASICPARSSAKAANDARQLLDVRQLERFLFQTSSCDPSMSSRQFPNHDRLNITSIINTAKVPTTVKRRASGAGAAVIPSPPSDPAAFGCSRRSFGHCASLINITVESC